MAIILAAPAGVAWLWIDDWRSEARWRARAEERDAAELAAMRERWAETAEADRRRAALAESWWRDHSG